MRQEILIECSIIVVLTTLIVQPIYPSGENRYLHSGFEVPPVNKSDNAVYAFWFSNITGNDEVKFRSSTDGGKTFTDKYNFIDSANTSSRGREIAISDNDIVISWWDKNASIDRSASSTGAGNGLIYGV